MRMSSITCLDGWLRNLRLAVLYNVDIGSKWLGGCYSENLRRFLGFSFWALGLDCIAFGFIINVRID